MHEPAAVRAVLPSVKGGTEIVDRAGGHAGLLP